MNIPGEASLSEQSPIVQKAGPSGGAIKRPFPSTKAEKSENSEPKPLTTKQFLQKKKERVRELKEKIHALENARPGKLKEAMEPTTSNRQEDMEKKCPELEEKCHEMEEKCHEMERKCQEMEKKMAAQQEELAANKAERRKLMNKIVDLKGNVRVLLKMRPVLQEEEEKQVYNVKYPSRQAIEISPSSDPCMQKHFALNHIFGGEARQEEIFAEVEELIEYRNAGNPLAHYDHTGQEILDQCEGKIDMVVMGAGTGGTVTGIARKLKEHLPNIKIVGVDPLGSILAEPSELNSTDVTTYEVEGIGYDFIPTVCDRSVVDSWRKSNDKESLVMARRIIREEGLLCGGSSGSVMSEAVKAAANLKEGQRCVVVLPDNIRNYLTKFVSDQWMESRGFQEPASRANVWWWTQKVSNMCLEAPLTVHPSVTCQEVVDIMKREGFDQIPVVDNSGSIQGMVTMANLMLHLINGKVQSSDPVEKVLYRQFRKITLDTPLSRVSRMLETDHFVLVIHSQKQYSTGDSAQCRESIVGILTPIDLLAYITSREGRDGTVDSECSSISQ